ncbi:MAG TPA: hypothetical protein VN310_13495 [Candidatus Dormibacteraeota bacterium]|nr:hypothetical protein [Candidatus Dormibacteraeota bacterium]
MRLPILVFHICAGISGILSGAVAMSFRKGSRWHRGAGNVFVISMMSLAASAVYLAIMKSQLTNVLGGVLTFYLVITAWLTARRRAGEKRMSDWGLLLFALAVGATLVTFGFQAVNSPTGLKYGGPAVLFFIFASLALLAAAGDVRMLVRGGVSGTQRLVRHLWRMCFALFFATGSFFLGQQQVFPAFLRNTKVLFIPAFLPLVLLIFWLIRVRFSKARNTMSMPRGSDVTPYGVSSRQRAAPPAMPASAP